MSRIIVSPVKPTEDDMAVWIDAGRHTGRLMTRLMGDGDPISIDLTDDGLTIIVPLPRTAVRNTAPTDGATPSPSVPKDAHEGTIGDRATLISAFKRSSGTISTGRACRPWDDRKRVHAMKRIKGIIIRTLAILAGFWLADLAAARIQAGIAAGRTAQQIMDDMTTMLRHPLMLGFDRASLLCGLAGAVAVGLFLLYRWSMGQRNWRDGEEYGSARWSKPEEMAPYTDGDISENLQMTRTEGLSLDTRATRRNLNTTVLGGSGSGKTATHVIPNILKANMDYACTDPKGELYGITHETLRRQGYEVRRLDLVDLTCETKFNPMQYIDPTKPDVSIMRLVTNIMDNTSGTVRKEHRTDDFWTKSERSLLTALIAFVHYLPDDILECLDIGAGQTLNAVADLRDLLEASEQDETKESPVDAVARTATEIYEEARAEWEREDADHEDPDLREAWRLAQGLCFAARQYRPFTQGAGETKKSIIISLSVRLAPLTVGPVREILSGDDIGIDRIGSYRDEHAGGYRHPAGKIAIFLVLLVAGGAMGLSGPLMIVGGLAIVYGVVRVHGLSLLSWTWIWMRWRARLKDGTNRWAYSPLAAGRPLGVFGLYGHAEDRAQAIEGRDVEVIGTPFMGACYLWDPDKRQATATLTAHVEEWTMSSDESKASRAMALNTMLKDLSETDGFVELKETSFVLPGPTPPEPAYLRDEPTPQWARDDLADLWRMPDILTPLQNVNYISASVSADRLAGVNRHAKTERTSVGIALGELVKRTMAPDLLDCGPTRQHPLVRCGRPALSDPHGRGSRACGRSRPRRQG